MIWIVILVEGGFDGWGDLVTLSSGVPKKKNKGFKFLEERQQWLGLPVYVSDHALYATCSVLDKLNQCLLPNNL